MSADRLSGGSGELSGYPVFKFHNGMQGLAVADGRAERAAPT